MNLTTVTKEASYLIALHLLIIDRYRMPSRAASGYTVDFGIANISNVSCQTLDAVVISDHQSLLFDLEVSSHFYDSKGQSESKWHFSIKAMDWSKWDMVCELIARDWYIQSYGL